MAVRELEYGVPWCTVFLACTVLSFHLLTLIGNYQMAAGIGAIGTSTNGWSDVGLGMGKSMHEELDSVMSNISMVLTSAIEGLTLLDETIDTALASIGDKSSETLMQVSLVASTNHTMAVTSLAAMATATSARQLPPDLADMIPKIVAEVCKALDQVMDILEPPLLKIGDWVTSFGDKLQAKMEQFSTTIDLVQNMFDQIMTKVSGGGGNDEYMELNTYTLFAMSRKDEGITVQDLKDLSQIYSITALQGSKAEDLHAKYDDNQDALVDPEEYKDFVNDITLTGIMGVVLRCYAKRLSEVAGVVKQAKMRDEVANAVVHYLQLVAAKNMTKVGWISDRLTNASVPLAFTACIMKNLAQAADDPSVLTTTDVGATVVGMMTQLNADYTRQAIDLLEDADWWASEGFDPMDQPPVVEKANGWTASSLLQMGAYGKVNALHVGLGGPALPAHQSLLQVRGSERKRVEDTIVANISRLVRARAWKSSMAYQARQRSHMLARYNRMKSTDGARHMFQSLLGGRFAWQQDPAGTATVSKGTPAVPETLEFAAFLASNATDCAQEFQGASFNYTGQSSSTMDNFATQIQGFVKKTQSVISMAQVYSGTKGVEMLRAKIDAFEQNAEAELTQAVGQFYSRQAVDVDIAGAVQLYEKRIDPDEAYEQLGDNWAAIVEALNALQDILPPTVENLKIARTEVSELTSTLDSIFDTFKKQGPPIFYKLAANYRLIWTFYFVALAAIALTILYYGFWASGYFEKKKEEGAAAASSDEAPAPKTFCEKYICCCNCFTRCFECCEGDCCFWCLLFSLQLLLLILFLISIVFCLLAGIQMFMASGCEQIYMLADEPICTETLVVIQDFLETFDAGVDGLDPLVDSFEGVCARKELMLCQTLGKDMMNAAVFSVSGSFLAVFFSFQLVVEVCVLHERRWWVKHLKEEAEAAGKA